MVRTLARKNGKLIRINGKLACRCCNTILGCIELGYDTDHTVQGNVTIDLTSYKSYIGATGISSITNYNKTFGGAEIPVGPSTRWQARCWFKSGVIYATSQSPPQSLLPFDVWVACDSTPSEIANPDNTTWFVAIHGPESNAFNRNPSTLLYEFTWTTPPTVNGAGKLTGGVISCPIYSQTHGYLYDVIVTFNNP